MVPVRKVSDQFEARVIAARLGSAGFVTELRGRGASSLYPWGPIEICVSEDDLEGARELLLADDVESAFDDDEPGSAPTPWPTWMGIVVVAMILLVVVVRMFSFGA
jgi:hypothetical protein